MAYGKHKHNDLRNLYVINRWNMKQVCQSLGISYITGCKWKTKAKASGDDWDLARNAYTISQGGLGEFTQAILEDFLIQFKSANEALKNDAALSAQERAVTIARLSDAYVKVVRAASSSHSELSKLSSALEMLKLLTVFIQREFPQHSAIFLEILEPFGREVSAQYG